MTVKAIITRVSDVPHIEVNNLFVSIDAVIHAQTGYATFINYDVPFTWTTSQVELRNAVRNTLIQKAAELGHTLTQNDIIFPLS